MASTHQDRLQACISTLPPSEGVTLEGYVVMAEWMTTGGHKVLTRLVGDHTSSWAAKGYLYEGLHKAWPANPVGRDNPDVVQLDLTITEPAIPRT
jgi:hypothetical protein